MAATSIGQWFRVRILPSDEIEQARTTGALLVVLFAALFVGALASGAVAWATHSLVCALIAGGVAGIVVSPLAAIGADLGVLLEVGFDGFHHHLEVERSGARVTRWTVTVVVAALGGAVALFLLPCAVVGAVLCPLPGELALQWARLVTRIGCWWAARHRFEQPPLGPYRTPAIVPATTPPPGPDPLPSARGAQVLEAIGMAFVWLAAITCITAEAWLWFSAFRD